MFLVTKVSAKYIAAEEIKSIFQLTHYDRDEIFLCGVTLHHPSLHL